MSQSKQLRALRGATSVPHDDADAIVTATAALIDEMLVRNGVPHHDLVSMIFTATADLTAEFPAVAARRLGISHIPLLCAREIEVPGSVPRCVRVLVHLYTERASEDLKHVYLGDARKLRTDLLE